MMNVLLVASCLVFPAQGSAEAIAPDQNVPSVNKARIAASVSTIAESLRKAKEGLAAGKTGSETLAAQQKAVEELQKLIDAAKSQARSNNSRSQSSAAMQPQVGTEGTPREDDLTEANDPRGGTASDRADKASSSDENAVAPAGSRDALHHFRASVVRDAWGHLPQRLRDQILNAGSEKYLPKYDDLVRDYFESLAKPDGDDLRPARVPDGP